MDNSHNNIVHCHVCNWSGPRHTLKPETTSISSGTVKSFYCPECDDAVLMEMSKTQYKKQSVAVMKGSKEEIADFLRRAVIA